MFRKLVSSLPFSPALVGQLGFYARRLSKEQASRRLGLIFTVLALVVQCFALFSPPEPTYAAPPSAECQYANTLMRDDPDCAPCPSNANIWINDPGCNKDLRLSIEVINLTRGGKSAAGGAVSASDRLQYTLRTTNIGTARATTTLEVSLKDVSEYAVLTTHNGGGTHDVEAQRLTWGSVALAAGQTDTRSFVMAVKDQLPITPQAVDDPASWDCIMTISYGNRLENVVNCPVGKTVEGAVKQLPETGAGENIVFSTVVLMIVTYFYVRSRQLAREMKVLRRQYNVG